MRRNSVRLAVSPHWYRDLRTGLKSDIAQDNADHRLEEIWRERVKANEAKRASAANLPKRGSMPKGAAIGTMDETILETYRNLQATH